MAGSVFGNIFKISTWGESHGEGLGNEGKGFIRLNFACHKSILEEALKRLEKALKN